MHLPPDDGGLVGDDGDEGGDGRDEGGDGKGRVGARGGELVAAPRGGEGGEGGGPRNAGDSFVLVTRGPSTTGCGVHTDMCFFVLVTVTVFEMIKKSQPSSTDLTQPRGGDNPWTQQLSSSSLSCPGFLTRSEASSLKAQG